MKNLFLFILLHIFGMCLPHPGNAQTIVRSTMSSAGATFSNSAGTLTSTFGQCSTCGTLKSDRGYLTQGFQQPGGEPCADSVSVLFTTKNETCPGDLDGTLSPAVSGGNPPYQFLWSNGQTTENIQNLGTATYQLTITDARGCTRLSAVEVATDCLPAAGDILTPNGDGENDTWVIAKIELYPDNEVQIFNRWGGLVFQSKNYLNTWVGINSNGEPLPLGAYYYVVKLNGADGTVLSGAVTIVR